MRYKKWRRLRIFGMIFPVFLMCFGSSCGQASDREQTIKPVEEKVISESEQTEMPKDDGSSKAEQKTPKERADSQTSANAYETGQGQERKESGRDESSGEKESGGDESSGEKESGSGMSAAIPSVTGPLHVEGAMLCSSAGEPVQLRGISTHGLAWFPQYVNEACFAQLKREWNINVIRLAMYTAEYGGYCTGGDREALKQLIRDGVSYALNQDMYAVIDWHILSDANPNQYLTEAKSFFDEISAEYKDADHILYEICNEPNGGVSWSEIKNYANEVIPVIRANDPDAVIITGTPNWSQYVDEAAADPITEYDNIMYALHFYAASHKDGLRSKMQSALAAGLPVFVSEFGIGDASGNGAVDIEQANQWIELMDSYGVSYIAWNLSNKDETTAVLKSSCETTDGFTEEDLSEYGKWLYHMFTEK